MQIDWTTFVLEVINFLALVWILKRFLYRPVLDVLARRRAEVERNLADGREKQAQAAVLRDQFEQRLAEWEKEKAALRADLDTELAAERERQMQVLQRTLGDERARQIAQEAHRRADSQHELEIQAISQAGLFASRLLTRLADPALESRLLDMLVEDLEHLPEEQRAGLREAANDAGASSLVVSAWPLTASQRNYLTQALEASIGQPIVVVFIEDARVVAGLRVSVGPWQLKANLADELSFFAASANHVA